MRKELQQLLHSTYSVKNDISTLYTIGSDLGAYIRFELGGEVKNGTKERIQQVSERMKLIFNEGFKTCTDIWVLIYEYDQEQSLNQASNEYLHQQLNTENFKELYKSREEITTHSFESLDVTIIICKPQIASINTSNIFKGIANLEMGFEPAIGQDIYFISPLNGTILHMYDDRGCDLTAAHPDSIRHVYEHCNDWILDYNREEIDKYFN